MVNPDQLEPAERWAHYYLHIQETLNELSQEKGLRPETAFSLCVRAVLKAVDKPLSELAADLEMNRTTLAARLSGQNPLQRTKPKDKELVLRIAEIIKLPFDSILAFADLVAAEAWEAEARARGETTSLDDEDPASVPGWENLRRILEYCLDNLEDPEAGPGVKARSREMIISLAHDLHSALLHDG